MYWIALYDLLGKPGGSRFSSVDSPPDPTGPGPPSPRATPRTPSGFAACTAWVCSAALPTRRQEGIRVLRGYLRPTRAGLVTECGRSIQHMQKALEQMNVKLTEAVSDITGKTGMSIIKAILAGERDPTRLAQLRDRRCQQDAEQIARLCKGP